MNTYSTKFFARCPTNQVRIEYALSIRTADVLSVESIIDALDEIDEGYHEEIADDLMERFGGWQSLRADHHGVTIETVRSGKTE